MSTRKLSSQVILKFIAWDRMLLMALGVGVSVET